MAQQFFSRRDEIPTLAEGTQRTLHKTSVKLVVVGNVHQGLTQWRETDTCGANATALRQDTRINFRGHCFPFPFPTPSANPAAPDCKGRNVTLPLDPAPSLALARGCSPMFRTRWPDLFVGWIEPNLGHLA